VSPHWHHFGDTYHLLVLTKDLAVGRSVENEKVEGAAGRADGKAGPSLL
jgi:hypothetical protein